MNLVTNALKYTTNGSVNIKAKLKGLQFDDSYNSNGHNLFESSITKSQQQTFLVIEVKDSGQGITDDKLKNLFKLLNKSQSNMSQTGIGLGLTICKNICQQLDGGIKVKSTVGKGSAFKFRVKVEQVRSVALEEKFSFPDEMINEHSDSERPVSVDYEQSLHNQTNPFQVRSYKKSQFVNLYDDQVRKTASMNTFSSSYRNLFNSPSPNTIQKFDYNSIKRKQSHFPFKESKPLSISQDCNQCNKILVIDDNYFNIDALELMIELVDNHLLGRKVDHAENGIQGLKCME